MSCVCPCDVHCIRMNINEYGPHQRELSGRSRCDRATDVDTGAVSLGTYYSELVGGSCVGACPIVFFLGQAACTRNECCRRLDATSRFSRKQLMTCLQIDCAQFARMRYMFKEKSITRGHRRRLTGTPMGRMAHHHERIFPSTIKPLIVRARLEVQPQRK